ncbi:alpha/beta fold hydrolase [Streptomyces hyaluromycini]|uniref:alpha/beta fold hydrolase n=1 Tax=Streptomyces hyaluromycini TaxID=1377993 RepID=UPI001FE6F1D9|nr:alpha/beta hydrolase [Streptomyces hyaluromycini]
MNGTRLHYVVGGSGEPVVLLHGWPETWWAYRKLMPRLAEQYRVIAVDHRGIGIPDELKPTDGFTKKNMARDVYELICSLGYSSASFVGHDMGAMVGYSFAANHPEATRRLALLDVVHPDESYYSRPMLRRPNTGFNMWWMAFNQVRGLPEQVFADRGWYLIDWLYTHSLMDQESITAFDRAVYARAYDTAAGIRATNGYYQAYHQDIEDLKGYDKVTVPILALAAPTQYDQVQDQLSRSATDVRMVLVEKSMHWLAEDASDLVARELLDFLAR